MKHCLLKSYDFTADPVELLELLKGQPSLFFLDSSLNDPVTGRYSFIGFDPFLVVQEKGSNVLPALRQRFFDHFGEDKKPTGPSPFAAGIMGFFSYDFGLHLEKIKKQASDDLGLPDCLFGFYDCVITIDHFLHKLYITSSGLPEKQGYWREKRALARLEYVEGFLAKYHHPKRKSAFPNFSLSDEENLLAQLNCNFSRESYEQAVVKAQEYIGNGDIYQVNLSQRFMTSLPRAGNSVEQARLYESLRSISPSCFGGYFDGGDFQIVSSSPEGFLRLRNGMVQTRPMKGTRPRGQNITEDRFLKEDLCQSPKDRAELLMITDLERNDLGRVCEFGSVKVKSLRTLEEYRTVFQTTSLIEGRLRADNDYFDLIAACFPGGSVTGCPKIRAMEIIEELEPTRRGPYTGAMGYISDSGAMDFNILIRTLLSHRQNIYFQTGGGIVADSRPEEEYEETLVKARALALCLAQALGFAGKMPELAGHSSGGAA